MRAFLIPQQFEISRYEANCLCQEISRLLYQHIDEHSKLSPLELLAMLQLRTAGQKLARRLTNLKPAVVKFRFTLNAYEIIAIQQLINTYPIALYNIMSEIDRKCRHYDRFIEIYIPV